MPGNDEPASADAAAAALSEELRIAVWSMSRRMRGEVQQSADVPVAHQAVLALLDLTPGMTSAELARAESMRPQSMNKTVAALRDAGHVQVSPSATDGRRLELRLTSSGAALLARVRSLRGDWLTERIEHDLNGPDRDALRRAAVLIRRLATDAPRSH